ncbi:MAG: DMT family transporter [Pyrinomonadaceae bacterium]
MKQQAAYRNSIFALLTVQAAFGTFPVIGKAILAWIPSTTLVGFRVGITALILYSFQRWRSDLRLQRRSDYLRLAILSLFGVTFNQLLFVGGLAFTKASNTSLLAVTIPIFTILIGWLWGSEKLTWLKLVGIAFAAAGVLMVIDPRKASFTSETTIGDLMIVANSLSFGTYVATSKDVVTRNGPMRSITWIFLFAAAVCVPLGAYTSIGVELSSMPPLIWAAIIHAAVLATALPYFLNAWAIARVDPSTVAVFIYLQPLIGFIMAAIFLGESIGPAFIAASLMIFAGVFIVTRRTSR